jgi:hypothetical protein
MPSIRCVGADVERNLAIRWAKTLNQILLSVQGKLDRSLE